MTGDWNWKDKSGRTAGLLYEPGNWGDMLKGVWITRIVRAMADMPPAPGGTGWTYRDVFAGAAEYPLTAKTAERLARLADTLLPECALPFLRRDCWPSAATLAHAASRDSETVTWQVMDAEAERARTYEASPWCDSILIGNGWESAKNDPSDAGTLLVIDPYDCLAGVEQALATLRAHHAECSILVYLYNRSARGRECLHTYRGFRNALDDIRDGAPMLLGRVAADGFLPSAHHEMIFLPYIPRWPAEQLHALEILLRKDTQLVHQAIGMDAVFESR